MNTIKITDNELAVLTAIDASEYGDNIHDAIWAWSIAQNCPLKATSIGGIVASLQKKGLVTTTDVGTRDAATAMTELGAREYVARVGYNRRKWIDKADLEVMRKVWAAKEKGETFVPPAVETKSETKSTKGDTDAQLFTRATNIQQNAEELATLLPTLAFVVESVAHLQGKERDLLPLSDRLRAILAGNV